MYETVMQLVSTDDKQATVVNTLNELQQRLLRMKITNTSGGERKIQRRADWQVCQKPKNARIRSV